MRDVRLVRGGDVHPLPTLLRLHQLARFFQHRQFRLRAMDIGARTPVADGSLPRQRRGVAGQRMRGQAALAPLVAALPGVTPQADGSGAGIGTARPPVAFEAAAMRASASAFG
ncbi:hypothetical protein G6F31_020560 [Rhizopus arrhizus]|nr:hypothetical protein G6F31_020560 [Rhizopus arrhizus]